MASAGIPQCMRERGRKVAVKRFHRPGSRTYLKELTALKKVGTHPNVLRLLESFQGFGSEDVLVLEYCDGSTLYDLYAREHPKGGLPERLVARLVRQLFLALEHLANCGIEHQDVKPENMMLYDVSVSTFQAELKLGDFGWAAISPAPGEGKSAKPPPTGAGSLWYAPPELNPPVEGIEMELAVDNRGEPVRGYSDMWSAGVVLYLLLVGHNPFNQALKQPTPEAQDQEVLRLVAHGNYNRRTDRWLHLHSDARDLMSLLLRVSPMQRASAAEALQHAFVTKRTVAGRTAGYGGGNGVAVDGETSGLFHGSFLPAPWAGRERRWSRLDGLQRLGWLAIARAVAEPELDRSVVQGALDAMEQERQREEQKGSWDASSASTGIGKSREAGYLWQLARELSTTPIFQWLQDRSAWPDGLRLAFSFLDVDQDGLLSPQDIVAHCAGPPVPQRAMSKGEDPMKGQPAAVAAKASGAEPSLLELANRWIDRWEVRSPGSARGEKGLSIAGLREALLASCSGDDALFGLFDDVDDGIVGEGDLDEDGRGIGKHRGEDGLDKWSGMGAGDLSGTGGSSSRGGGLQLPQPPALAATAKGKSVVPGGI